MAHAKAPQISNATPYSDDYLFQLKKQPEIERHLIFGSELENIENQNPSNLYNSTDDVLNDLFLEDLFWNQQNFVNSLFLLVPPSISSISPTTPQTSVRDQNVTVNGSNFASGLTVTVTFPNGGTGTLSGSQIQNRTSTSFVMVVTLNATGTWRIRVNNPNGEQSGQFSFNVNAAQTPSISSISPSSPTVSNSDQNVQVSGSNFQSGMTVTVFFPGGGSGTLSGTQLQNVTPTSFRMVTTLNIVGTYSIRINNPSNLQSSTFNFTTRAVSPSISNISPSGVCAQNGDRTFTVSGSNFQSGLTVTVFFPNGGSTTLSGTQIQFNSSTSFNMIVTLNVIGTYNFRVNNPNGTNSSNQSYTTQNCNPNISSISPPSPTVGNSNQTVRVSGSNFQSGLTVTVFFPNNSGSSTLSGSQIQFISSGSFDMIVTLNVLGQYQIRVNNPNGTTSSNFEFNTQAAAPSISNISPTTPCVRNVDQSVSVSGNNFVSGLTVSVTFPNGQTGNLSGTQIQNVTSTSFTMIITLADPGNYSIRVVNPNGSQSGAFTIPTQNCLSVSGINPSSPTQSNIDQNIVVSGNGFAANLTVTATFPNGTTGNLSGTQIQNVTSTSFTLRITLNASGTWNIKVRNPNGDLSNIHSFTVQAPAAPTVSSITPNSPLASNVDQNITVNGTNFQNGLTVTATFPNGGTGTLSGTQIQNVTSTSFTMRITFGNAGSWSLRVNNPNGGQSSPFQFTVQSNVQSPVIFSINPTTPTAGNTDQDVIVTGSNFQENLTVPITFPNGGGVTLSGTQIQNVTPTSFIMRATLNATGNWSIRVNNPDGGQSSALSFNVSGGGNNPIISSINPITPISNGADQNVTVNGSNFQNGLKVNVTFPDGGMAVLQGTGQIQNVTANSFLMRITLNGEGDWSIRVVNPDNSQSAQYRFNVQPSGPPPNGLPTSVLSPVIGPLRVTTSNQGVKDGKWEFNQHKTGFHTPTRGISLSNDTYAWDVNLYTPTSGNADAGKSVFAVADGQVVSYVGTQPGKGPGAVLIAHPNAANPIWFSGYLHMTNVKVTINQPVNATNVIGEIGRIGADNDHLHFVVYSGQNTRGNLRSFNTIITQRSSNNPNTPTISSITPEIITQSSDLLPITIYGSNFQPNSLIEIQSPDGRYFTVTPEISSSFNNENGDQVAQILNITSSSMTAKVPFTASGIYGIQVANPSLNDYISSQIYPKKVEPSGRTPVILIPGIMGSRLAKLENGQVGEELWIGDILTNHEVLKDYVEDPTNYKPISQRKVVATEILRNAGPKTRYTNFYGKLIDYLDHEKGYTLYDVPNPVISPCDTSRKDADLFVFPYDWRNSNWTSARDLYEFVRCIKEIRKDQPNSKIHIIAHSMGGLVARRYILNNPGSHHVERMVTLGTPWLGAPKFLNTLEFGDNLLGSWLEMFPNAGQSAVILPPTIKKIAPYMKGAHELIPSKAYVDDIVQPWNRPFGEDGWNNFDFDATSSTPVREYDFNRLKIMLNQRYKNPTNNPGDAAHTFHSQLGQDNWNGDTSGVSYYNFVGYGKNTIISLIAKKPTYWWGEPYFEQVKLPDGDGTVPLASALRRGRKDYRGPIKLEKGFPLDHTELVSHGMTFAYIDCVVNKPNAEACINNPSSANLNDSESESFISESFVGEPNYLLKVIGSPSVLISDSFGNTTDPLSTSNDEGVRTVQTDVSGDKYLSATFPLDQNYKVVIKTPATPLSIILTKNDGQILTEAVRYVDIILPSNVLAIIEVTPQGVSTLKYDSDGNGTYDTQVNPTIIVTGTNAQDIEAPNVSVIETIQNGASQIAIQASDAGTGVQKIMYSLDGTTFQQYSAPLTLNAAQTPTIYAFADDNVINRSGLVSYTLGSLVRMISGNITYAIASAGQAPKSVSGVVMSAIGASSAAASSDSGGAYQFNNLTIGGQYTVTPSKTGDNGGITALDATLILRYVASGGTGASALSANQLIAADVNNSNTVTALDATQILRYVAAGGVNAGNGQVGTWKFSPATNNYSSLSSSRLTENYTAILIGEVNGGWISAEATTVESDDSQQQSIRKANIFFGKGRELLFGKSKDDFEVSKINQNEAEEQIPFSANVFGKQGSTIVVPINLKNIGNTQVSSFSFEVTFDPAVLQPAEQVIDTLETLAENCSAVVNTNNPGRIGIAGGCVNNIAATSGTLLNLHFAVKGKVWSSTPLTFNQSILFEDDLGNKIQVVNTDGKFNVLSN
jgi:pimeloyl-ACP methyl ester carboxylesterase